MSVTVVVCHSCLWNNAAKSLQFNEHRLHFFTNTLESANHHHRAAKNPEVHYLRVREKLKQKKQRSLNKTSSKVSDNII